MFFCMGELSDQFGNVSGTEPWASLSLFPLEVSASPGQSWPPVSMGVVCTVTLAVHTTGSPEEQRPTFWISPEMVCSGNQTRGLCFGA